MLNNLAILYKNTQRLEESETLYLEALEISRRLAKDNPQAYEPDVAATLYNLGLLHLQQEKYPEAITAYEEVLPIYRKLTISNPAYSNDYQYSLYFLTQLYPMTEEHSKYYEVNEEWLPIVNEHYQEDPETWKNNYALALGNQSFQCIFMGKFSQSEQYASEAISIDGTKMFVYTNLAAALLFQGKYDEAEQIYRQFKDELKDSFLQDFQDYEEAGVIPTERKADVERIKKMLNE